jgi:hypothetical protein
MGTIIILIVTTIFVSALIGYFLTREEIQKEESPLQKVLNKSLEKSAKDIKVKDAVVVKPRVTKMNASPEVLQFIEQSNELAKELDKIPTQDLAAYAANINTQGKEPVKSVKKRKYYPKSPKGKA